METSKAPDRALTFSAPDLNPRERMRQLILYIAGRSQYDRHFGVTKLNKILWFSDTWAFGQTGRPISGATYLRLPQGPVPDGIDELREEMQRVGQIAIYEQQEFGRTRKKVVALKRADLSQFSGAEIAMLDAVMDEHRTHNAKGVSNRSHGRMWEAVRPLHRMPYESVFISEAKPSRYDVKRTKELISQYGWE